MSYECCDDEDDACNQVGWEDDWDDDDFPPKEEPDCYSCNDSGCSACSHQAHCDCAYCFEAIVSEFEIFDDPDPEFAYTGPFLDEPPF